MKDFSPFQGPIFTFFSAPFYKDLLLHGKGMGFAYLFLLLSLIWAMETVKVYTVMQGFAANKDVVKFLEQIPGMSLKDNKFSIDRPSPWALKEPSSGQTIVYFDTSGKTQDLDHADGAKILVTQDYMLMEEKTGGGTKTLPWSDLKSDFSLESKDVKGVMSTTVTPMVTGVFWFLGIFAWMGHLMLALIYGALALIMDAKKLGYVPMVRLASFAMTPAMIISLLQFMIGFDIPYYGFLTIPLSLGFIYFGNQSLKDEPPLA